MHPSYFIKKRAHQPMSPIKNPQKHNKKIINRIINRIAQAPPRTKEAQRTYMASTQTQGSSTHMASTTTVTENIINTRKLPNQKINHRGAPLLHQEYKQFRQICFTSIINLSQRKPNPNVPLLYCQIPPSTCRGFVARTS